MKAFAELYTAIDQTTKTNAKVDALVEYFASAPETDVLWCVAMLTGKSPKRTIRSGELKEWSAEMSGLPYWIFDESYHIVGDLAETITLILPPPSSSAGYSLTETIAFLRSLDKYGDEDKKIAIQQCWDEMDTSERFVFNKLMTGSFRVGVSKQLVIKALARQFKIEEDTVAHRLTGDWSPDTTTLSTLLSAEGDTDSYYRPYPFYLAYQLEQSVDDLGDVHDWQIEQKYDGIRGQLLLRRSELFVWSRGEELMTEKFPEFEILKGILPDGTVIDGEVLPYRDGRPLPFHLMQTRIGRKNLTKKSLQEAPLILMCYDLLEYHGEDIRTRPMQERRALLEQVVKDANEIAAVPLLLSPVLDCQSWEEATQAREAARDNNCEGLMLKHKNSPYETGRRKGQWWKWKVDPLTVDGVLLYAQRGHGRRANLYTDYTFAIWDGDELVPFTKAYSGLTDKELLQVDNWIKRNTIDKFGPVRSVKAELVFEIAFEGINRSPRHKSGVALRFPRILRWRTDKKKEDANTKDDLMKLIEMQETTR